MLIAVASGQPGSTKWRRHRHRTSTSRGHSHERREAANHRAWVVRQQISFWRLGTFVCVLLILFWLAWCIIAQTAAQNLVKSDPNAALSWVADHSAALNQLAQQELEDPRGNLDSAREWARRALRSNPLNARALALLGLIAERKGDHDSADALMRISGGRTLSDATTDAWLFNRELRRADYSHALPYADAILRTVFITDLDAQKKQLFPSLAAFVTNPLAFKALTAFLATSPPWRTWFLSELSVRLANQARLVELYTALIETDAPPTKEELRPYLNRLIKDGNFEQAYQIWHKMLPPGQRANETYPFNRDFDIPVDGLPFNWVLETIPGADIQIVTSDNGGKALFVEFSGARVRFANVKQLMLLPAGDYVLRGRVKTEDLRTSRGLWWQVFCANNPATTLANTELVFGTITWTDFTVRFRVPATDCRAQWLRLELPARIDPELKIEGQVWYRDLRITPPPTAEPGPRDH
jgi:tetratricopeptide (TPR) repeat protein